MTTFPLEYAINGAFANMDRWVDRGIPAPSAERIAVTDPTSPTAAIVRDALGNAVGGLRTPAIDVPRAAYFGTTPGTGTCQILWGYEQALSDAQLAALDHPGGRADADQEPAVAPAPSVRSSGGLPSPIHCFEAGR